MKANQNMNTANERYFNFKSFYYLDFLLKLDFTTRPSILSLRREEKPKQNKKRLRLVSSEQQQAKTQQQHQQQKLNPMPDELKFVDKVVNNGVKFFTATRCHNNAHNYF